MSQRPSSSQMQAFMPALIFLGIFIALLVVLMPEPQLPPRVLPTPTLPPPTVVAAVPTTLPPSEVVADVAEYDAALIMEGQGIFQSTCSACHGLDGLGIPGLGKNLIESQFVHGLTDQELQEFIVMGRDTSDPLNTTGIAMPPSGGNPSLTAEQMHAVIAYIRSESGSAAVAQVVPAAAPTQVQGAATVTPAAPLADPILPTGIPVTPPPFSAQTAYIWSCAGCHGIDGKGNDPFASGFETSTLLADRAALLSFLIDGSPLAAPVTEFPHPPRGGYPILTDEQLAALTDYVISMMGES